MSPIETDPTALLRALAKIIDPDGKRYITGIRLEGRVKQIPTLTVWEHVQTGQLAELQEIVKDYQLIPAQPPL